MMGKKKDVTIDYRFERCAPASDSYLERFARSAQHQTETLPLFLPILPFASTSRVSSGILDLNPRPSLPETTVRLRSMESPEGILLEHKYDGAGRLLSTTYIDGIHVTYDWTQTSQVAVVRLSSGQTITYHYGEEGRLTKATYADGGDFTCRYTKTGRVCTRIFPDHKYVTYAYDTLGRPEKISFDGTEFGHKRHADGASTRVSFSNNEGHDALDLPADRLDVGLTRRRSITFSEPQFMSALGLWTYSSEGTLQEMVWPNGERLCFRRMPAGRVETLWNSLGQTRLVYDEQNVLSEVLHPYGVRTLYHRVPGTGNVYRVGFNHVDLYQYDECGKLLRIRRSDGQYSILRYDRQGMISGVKTAIGPLRFTYDESARLCSVKLPSGLSGQLAYGASKHPTSVSLSGVGCAGLNGILELLNQIWRWTTLRGSLRLEDPTLSEV